MGAVETDPLGRNPNEAGAKLDAGKIPVARGAFLYFPRAMMAVAQVSAFGAHKYTWNGWESVPDGIHRYTDAMARHMLLEVTDGNVTPDSGLLHAAHVAWNALAVLELKIREMDK